VTAKRCSKRYSREKRRANRDFSDDESIEYRTHEKRRSDDYSDEESVHDARRRKNSRSSQQRGGRRLVKDYYSDGDITLDESRSRRGISSKPACNGSRRGEAIKSSLEMLDAAAAPPTNHVPSKQSNTD
jgi:hypothetical protein